MNRAFSTYLDFTRFAAALTVVLHHLGETRLTGGAFDPVGTAGADAVMVFFVLSGYVIAYVGERDKSLPEYAINRLARLFSVVIPALLLTMVADVIGHIANPALYEGVSYNYPLIKTLISLAFLNQIWSFDVRFFSNVPYWSISYEFWFYVVFAFTLFARGWTRIALIAFWGLFVGPCILLLLPVWWLGVLGYRVTRTRTLSIVASWLCCLLPVPIYLFYLASGIPERLTAFTDGWVMRMTGDLYYLHKARFFLHDYVVGLLVVLHLLGAHGIAATRRTQMSWMDRWIRAAAASTFSTYLFHYPLLYCLAALSPFVSDGPAQVVYLLVGTFAIILALAPFTEGRKNEWRHMLHTAYLRVQLAAHKALPRFASPIAANAVRSRASKTQVWTALGMTVVLLVMAVLIPLANVRLRHLDAPGGTADTTLQP